MQQPLQGYIEDTFSTKCTNTEKGAVTHIKVAIKSACGEVLDLNCSWKSEVNKSQEEEEKIYVQRSVAYGEISFPRGAIVRWDENERCLYYEIPTMDFNKDKEKLSHLQLSNEFLRS